MKQSLSNQLIGRRSLLGGLAAAGAVGLTGSRVFDGSRALASAPAANVAPADLDSLDLLKRMISFDTQNFGNGGKTRPFAEMLKGVWDAAGVSTEIIPTPQPDNVHLIARIKGTTSAAPVLILGHSDVVPVEADKWNTDPFVGTVKNGQIFGRGALDMKGMDAASVSALLRHIDEGGKFERDIIVLTDCDEESGSYGSSWLAEQHWDKLDAGMVLTEGGWFLAQKDKTTPMLITVTRQDKVYFKPRRRDREALARHRRARRLAGAGAPDPGDEGVLRCARPRHPRQGVRPGHQAAAPRALARRARAGCARGRGAL
jgi:hypothetical protein